MFYIAPRHYNSIKKEVFDEFPQKQILILN